MSTMKPEAPAGLPRRSAMAFAPLPYLGTSASDADMSSLHGDDPAAAFTPGHAVAPARTVPTGPVTTGPVTTPAYPAEVDSDIFRLCFRLTGDRGISRRIAADAVQARSGASGCGPRLADAVERCLDTELPYESTTPHAQHRSRLRRELSRHNDTERAALALRHLVGAEPASVAAQLGLDENDVRRITGTWVPADADPDDGMLGGLDSWVGSGSVASMAARSPLAHLDDRPPPSIGRHTMR